jgi:hypothetical protein
MYVVRCRDAHRLPVYDTHTTWEQNMPKWFLLKGGPSQKVSEG